MPMLPHLTNVGQSFRVIPGCLSPFVRSVDSSCTSTSSRIGSSKGIRAGPIDPRSRSSAQIRAVFTRLPTVAGGVRGEQLGEGIPPLGFQRSF
jgi:hypothetical protein